MKLIKQWKDSQYNVENSLYENKDGLKIVHTLNPQSLESYISLTVKSGTYFEKDIDVPNGTAHFLEHMLCKPNKYFKTWKALDEFKFGNSTRASFGSNAATSYKYIYIYSFGNSNREEDMVKRVMSCIDFPLENFSKQIEKERKIILAELQETFKPEKDPSYNFNKFFYNGNLHNNDFKVLGFTEERIKSITVEHLIKMFKAQFNIENVILSIQSPKKISKKSEEYIEKLSNRLKENGANKATIHEESFVNNFDEGYFFDTELRGIKTVLATLEEDKSKKKDYVDDALFGFSQRLIRYVGDEILRKKYGYVYGISVDSDKSLTYNYFLKYIEMTTDFKNLGKALDSLYDVIHNDCLKFLTSSKGKKWFSHQLSHFLFPNNMGYIEDYAETKSIYVLLDKEIWNFEKAKEAVKSITIEMLSEYFKKRYMNMIPKFWFDSSEDLDKVKKVFHKTKFYKNHTS